MSDRPSGDSVLWLEVKLVLPNSAYLQNFGGFLRKYSPTECEPDLCVEMHHRWISVHPVALAMLACAGQMATQRGRTTTGVVPAIQPVLYLKRMGLFNFLDLDPGLGMVEHEEAGRFVPLTNIRSGTQLTDALANLVPLLHAPPEVAAPISYVFSEMVRNVLEHSASPVGAFVCAQYYPRTRRIGIGIADAGIGVLNTMQRYHVVQNDADAIRLALRPGYTGASPMIGGNEQNAGAGLFFTKSIAALSRQLFIIYSGSAMFKLLRPPGGGAATLNADPSDDYHRIEDDLPNWSGTVVGIDLSIEEAVDFADLLNTIRAAYSLDVRQTKRKIRRIRFE